MCAKRFFISMVLNNTSLTVTNEAGPVSQISLLVTNRLNKTEYADFVYLVYFLLLMALTVKTLNIGTPRLTTKVVLHIKQFNFTMQ